MKKGIIRRGSVGKKKGWVFAVYFDGKPYPNFLSALYKTRKEIGEKLSEYLQTGKFDFYGSAE